MGQTGNNLEGVVNVLRESNDGFDDWSRTNICITNAWHRVEYRKVVQQEA